ncbi:EsaB/YukD family protein [Terribacillus saccharophilus]|uniref:EsaB/YukD family protein n=1 Tax=Terribacillus saccharophilus TaxID=361277 RepID=UPI003981C822
MANTNHVNVTMDFRQVSGEDALYDLRIPTQLTVKQLLHHVTDTLHIKPNQLHYAIKVMTKHLVLADDDYLRDYPVTDGDVLVVL